MSNWTPNTANEIRFVMINSSGVEVAGLAGTFVLELCKPGAASFTTGAGTKDEIGFGWYQYVSTVGEADTEGEISIRVTGTGAIQQNLVYEVGANGIWANSVRTLTQAAASAAAALTGPNVTVYRGTTWTFTLTGLPSLTLYDVIYFTVKEQFGDADTAAWLQVRSGASGLLRFMSAAPAAAANGTLTTPSSTSITVTIQEAETINALLRNNLLYDIKGVDNDGNVDLISSGGLFNIRGDVTRAIT